MIRIVLICSWIMLAAFADCATAHDVDTPSAGSVSTSMSGDLAATIAHYKQVLDNNAHDQDSRESLTAMINLGSLYHTIGDFDRSTVLLESAVARADRLDLKLQAVAARLALGSTLTFSRQPAAPAKGRPSDVTRGRAYLVEAAKFAEDIGNDRLLAEAYGALASLCAAEACRQSSRKAAESFQRAMDFHRKSFELMDDPVERSRLQVNAAVTAQLAGFDSQALGWIKSVIENPPDRVGVMLTAGRVAQRLDDNSAHALASKAYQHVLTLCQSHHDPRGQSYALGFLAELDEQEGRLDDALDRTHKALFYAQQTRQDQLIYRWQWQDGRLLNQVGQPAKALAAYQRATQTLDQIRNDITAGGGNLLAIQSLRQTIGPMYYELADLRLKQAQSQDDLRRARDSIEEFKSAELDEYFNDQCLVRFRRSQTPVDQVDPNAAIVYIIPLSDRIETVVSLPDGSIHRQANHTVNANQLEQVVRTFRRNLQDPLTERYITYAGRLYDLLMRPLEPLLQSHDIQTLVFVPDGSLRMIPMAACYDGHQFLVERYAVAITPGLTLMSSQPMHRERTSALICGISQSEGSFEPLQHVQQETASISSLFQNNQLTVRTLMNDEFRVATFDRSLQDITPTIVHIASHGQFATDPSQTYLLTADKDSGQALSLNTLEQIVRPMQFQNHPVELLTLSACQTAIGDDRAALGLAGVAIKAGARSALASLWLVNDEASATIMHDFYAALLLPAKHADGPTYRSKAQALRIAQVKQIKHPILGHPYYWSAFMMIGNWR